MRARTSSGFVKRQSISLARGWAAATRMALVEDGGSAAKVGVTKARRLSHAMRWSGNRVMISSTPLRRFVGEATELFHRFVIRLHRGGSLRFADGIAALLTEALNGLNAPAGAAARDPDGRVADVNSHRVCV